MPITFSTHQLPALVLKRHAPDRWDGLGLVVGSIMPDLWYTTTGWLGYVGNGQPKWVDAHPWSLQIQYCIVPGFVLTLLLRRVVMPVVPAVLPKAGLFRLRDYRLLALSRHRWWVTAYSVAVGAASHLVLDAVFSPRPLAALADVVGAIAAGLMLRSISRQKLQWAWHGYSTRPPDPVVRRGGSAFIRTVLAVGFVGALAYGAHRFHNGIVVSIMGFSCVILLTLLVAGVVGRPFVEPLPAAPSSPAAVDPLVE